MHSIDNTSETPLCSLCGESTETVSHIVIGCRKLAQEEYRKRHDAVALQVHWELYRKYGLECNDSGMTVNLPVAENREAGKVEIWLFYAQAAKAQSSRYYCSIQRYVGVDNYRHCCTSGLDQNIHRATRVKVIPVVIVALGTISGNANCITSFGLILFTKHKYRTVCGSWSGRKRRKWVFIITYYLRRRKSCRFILLTCDKPTASEFCRKPRIIKNDRSVWSLVRPACMVPWSGHFGDFVCRHANCVQKRSKHHLI